MFCATQEAQDRKHSPERDGAKVAELPDSAIRGRVAPGSSLWQPPQMPMGCSSTNNCQCGRFQPLLQSWTHPDTKHYEEGQHKDVYADSSWLLHQGNIPQGPLQLL